MIRKIPSLFGGGGGVDAVVVVVVGSGHEGGGVQWIQMGSDKVERDQENTIFKGTCKMYGPLTKVDALCFHLLQPILCVLFM